MSCLYFNKFLKNVVFPDWLGPHIIILQGGLMRGSTMMMMRVGFLVPNDGELHDVFYLFVLDVFCDGT